MKTLANCNPREFLVQTNRIRKSVANWLTITRIHEIRKQLPDLPKDASPEEKREMIQKQVQKNLTDILDSVLDEHPEETADLLGLLCFVEPADLENHKMTEFLGAVAEILNSPEVIDFFISLANLDRMSTSGSATPLTETSSPHAAGNT